MIILCGKSGVGKDKLQSELVKLGYETVVSYTTRPIRPGEVEGINYFYIDEEKFLKLKREGFFAETTSYDVAADITWHYGSAKSDLTKNKVMIANPEGVKELIKNNDLSCVVYYVMADKDVVRERLKMRGDNPSEVQRRMLADDNDFKGFADICDVEVVNNTNKDVDAERIARAISNSYKKLIGGVA